MFGPTTLTVDFQLILKGLFFAGMTQKKTQQTQTKPSWWFQPIWKILVKMDHFPK